MINENGNISEQSVTAIAKSGNRLKAVDIRKQGTTIEVLMTKSSEENVFNWRDFAARCNVSFNSTEEAESENRKPVAVGYDSAGTAFSRVSIPAVEDKELESIVKLQAESRLPLPADQMEIAWRADKGKEGQLAITIAAARRQQVQNFIDKVNAFKPTNIFLDCEGIVKVWKEIFSGNTQNAVIINTDSRNTHICLAQKGKLINAVALDMGVDDFTEAEGEVQSENIERFVLDTRSIVDLFGVEKSEKLQVYILSDGSEIYNDLASALKDTGLNAALAKPDVKKFSSKSNLSVNDIFDYRLQIGLALMVIEASGKELNLFKDIYKPYGEDKQKHWLYSPKIAGAIAAAVLVIFMGVVFAIDVTKPNKIKNIIEEVAPDANIPALIEQQKILKAIQQLRPDFLKLISELSEDNINESSEQKEENNGRIQLESLNFKKGKKITITGVASNDITLYNFEERLNKIPGISEVTWNPSSSTRSNSSSSIRTRNSILGSSNSRNRNFGSSNNRTERITGFDSESVRFTMEFHYGNFTVSRQAKN
jgi:Tfp pilus assembly PilM family ATPase